MSPILAWLVVGALVLTLVLLLSHIGYRLFMVLRRRGRETAIADARRADDQAGRAAREAESAEAGGDHILGVRLLFRACLAQLEECEGRTFRLGATNREHLARYRQTPLYDLLAQFVWVIHSNGTAREPAWPPTLSPVTTRTNGSARWPPHPPRARMLNTRNVVAAAVLITLVSLVGACLAMFEPPGGGGLGTDSYGTRGHGYKAALRDAGGA